MTLHAHRSISTANSGAQTLRNLALCLTLCVALCGLSGCVSERAETIAGLTGDAELGQPLYTTHCVRCHADDLSGTSVGPALKSSIFDASTIDIILDGEDEMPPYDNLSDEDIANMVAYIESIQ